MSAQRLDMYVAGGRDCRQYMDTFRVKIQKILSDLNLQPLEIICCTVDGQEGRIPYKDVVRQYYDQRESVYISDIGKYVNPAKLCGIRTTTGNRRRRFTGSGWSALP